MFCIKHKYHVFIAIATSSQLTHHVHQVFTESMKTNVKSIEYGKLFPVGVIVCSVYERKRNHKVNDWNSNELTEKSGKFLNYLQAKSKNFLDNLNYEFNFNFKSNPTSKVI